MIPARLPIYAAAGATSAAARLASRSYHATSALRYPYKDDQDRESLRPGGAHNTNTARDADVAANKDAAFNRHKTSPEEELETAGAGPEPGNPLEVSGANHEVSKPLGDDNTPPRKGPGKEVRKGGASGGHSAPKNKKT
ncbi:hypothetical protein ACRE_028270 [Hapsidospora chrysogenum ATCC 11550]|uniref:Uncharacterized protein n=1 Tax=Hapsidospora chrysogenum (strain ATCC 11550 / CBS 779.69 / DSM 880 / IAM 14645 / JCM 23072 / IMI 49137) TaxID=857340 RepID=A0A086TAK0_HAPC1|nr:hypothetical protein ACRE_028270 [Hapsidospora chrysogenum ATCC 11550]